MFLSAVLGHQLFCCAMFLFYPTARYFTIHTQLLAHYVILVIILGSCQLQSQSTPWTALCNFQMIVWSSLPLHGFVSASQTTLYVFVKQNSGDLHWQVHVQSTGKFMDKVFITFVSQTVHCTCMCKAVRKGPLSLRKVYVM